jgi:hypothetical protein
MNDAPVSLAKDDVLFITKNLTTTADVLNRLPVVDEGNPVLVTDACVTTQGIVGTISPAPTPTNTTTGRNRPTSLSKHHPRIMSIDSSSIDLDAIDIASIERTPGKDNRKYSEMDDSGTFIQSSSDSYFDRNVVHNSNSTTTKSSSTTYLVDLYKQHVHVPADHALSGTASCKSPSDLVNAQRCSSVTSPISSNIEEKMSLSSTPTMKKVAGKEQNQQQLSRSTNDTKDSSIYIKATRIPISPHEKAHRIRLGVCAMDKKARSKPMAEILSRLNCECKFEKRNKRKKNTFVGRKIH